MTFKYMAALVVSGILTVALPLVAGVQHIQAAEVAGADDDDKATKDQLKQAGQDQVPAEGMKKAEPKSEPTMKPVSQPAPEKPAAATPTPVAKPAETPAAKPAGKMMADTPGIVGPYLRLDVGYGLTMDPDGTTTAGAMTDEDVANLGLFGGGIGYQFNDSLRADMTIDYRPDADVDATTAGGTLIASEVNGMTAMLNAYYDMGNFDGFTPYLGAGIGIARLETSDQTGTAAGGDTSTNFAWALMLGAAIDVGFGGQTKADLGYRFVSLGEFQQDDGTEYDDLLVHELRAGLRHMF